MTMIERVALALYEADGLKHAHSGIALEQSWAMSPSHHGDYLRRARAAIEAMREPTEAMVEAGAMSIHNEPDGPGELERDRWTARTSHGAMIDAALNETPA